MQMPLALKGILLIFVLCVVVRVISALGAGSAPKDYMADLASNKNIVEAILDFELGSAGKADNSVALTSVVLDPSIFGDDAREADVPEDVSPTTPDASPDASPSGTGADGGQATPSGAATQNPPSASPSSTPNVITQPAKETSADVIALNNKAGYSVDTAALLKQPLKLTLSSKDPSVLIIHTHSSEAYMRSGQDQYEESDPFRTQDKSQSIIRVGAELAEAFEKAGIKVIHDTGVYDYPSYEGAYNRSYDAIQSYLKKYPSIKMVIDMHRDAIEAADGSVYRTVASIGDTKCSQVLMVIGTDASGLKHPNWKENFKLALHIQQEMNTLYPTLAKPIELSQFRYNQQATLGSMIVEIGCTGNTLQESLTSVRYFADAASKVLLGLTK
ncbi:stage II sporulation protein P [Sporobacter termitidis DSM 10068]|uniref:Stage II sporulation protein P n=1 Tax=Sporobacter termitidis DSM 10068 TaxID=1123282 RepID=A0A1M5Y771_9FIRM|nr:stage II sporulation protein P [Sporobacter termitidis]SHI07333.1 stage II sporulation protein P [Sporobacter termitidis DSM 10068]